MNMKKNVLIDVIAFVVYLVAANPVITGIDVHEWLGFGALLVLFVHFAVHVDWMAETLRKETKKPTFSGWGNLVLDTLALIVLLVVVVSGIGISGEVLPSFGFYMDGYFFWSPLHSISAKVLLAILVLHIIVHGRWIIAFFGRSTGVESGEEN